MSNAVGRTVTLELLRHGPAHNQLLSPLTRYLALCGNHRAETVTVPFEHQQFLIRQRALRSKDLQTRDMQLQETAQTMGKLLGAVPGLIAEMSEAGPALTHLRLVLSASELALLPFEAADAPRGLPGAGQPLALQSEVPLCITREARRVGETCFSWPLRKPRILFAAAAPPGVGAVPMESHLLALRRVITPWVKYFDPQDKPQRQERIEEHLVLLPRASLRAIEERCRSGRFTHVHILAHGVPIREGADERFGLALHDAGDPSHADLVNGIRLATALRTHRDACDLARPAVVTLASCDSGAGGSVIGAGSSLAHALHVAGIPLVVASQYPLSFPGSVVLTEILYDGLLRGLDPRCVLSNLRRQLRTRVSETLDWASLVAYATLPDDLSRQLEEGRVLRAKASIEAAHDRIDSLIEKFRGIEESMFLRGESADPGSLSEDQRRLSHALDSALDLLDKGHQWLRGLSEESPDRDVLFSGLLASAEKRKAQVRFRMSSLPLFGAKEAEAFRRQSLLDMKRALHFYERVFQLDIGESWAVVQYLCLSAVLGHEDERFFDLWTLARTAAEIDVAHSDPRRVAWAYSSLCELFILAPVVGRSRGVPGAAQAKRRAQHYARELLKVTARDSPELKFDRYAAYRQFLRYPEWFKFMEDFDKAREVVTVANAVVGEIEKAVGEIEKASPD